MSDFLARIGDWLASTGVQAQLSTHDYAGLFTNPWFIVPLVCLIGYLLYKQSFNYLILLAIFTGVWMFTGTPYMQDLFASSGDGVQLGKILPVMLGGAVVLAVVVYLVFGRSD